MGPLGFMFLRVFLPLVPLLLTESPDPLLLVVCYLLPDLRCIILGGCPPDPLLGGCPLDPLPGECPPDPLPAECPLPQVNNILLIRTRYNGKL